LNAHAEAVSRESEERERGLHELTAIIRARDARIAEAERVAEERLASLEALHAMTEEIRREAEKRERGLHELTAIIGARDARIAEVERMAEERLASLKAMHVYAEELRSESEKQLQEKEIHTAFHVDALREAGEKERSTQASLGESLVREGELRKEILEFKSETILGFLKRKIRARKSRT